MCKYHSETVGHSEHFDIFRLYSSFATTLPFLCLVAGWKRMNLAYYLLFLLHTNNQSRLTNQSLYTKYS
jgi:hypothetical protein